MRGRAQVDAPARLRALLDEGLVVAPFVFDALQALAAEQAGARAVHLTGFGMAASHGDPDVGLVGLREIVAAAGVTAIHIEDQHWPKRCGFFAGKEVVAVGEMEAKVRAAVDAAGPGGAVVIARTDALAPLGWREAESRAPPLSRRWRRAALRRRPRHTGRCRDVCRAPRRPPPRLQRPAAGRAGGGARLPVQLALATLLATWRDRRDRMAELVRTGTVAVDDPAALFGWSSRTSPLGESELA